MNMTLSVAPTGVSPLARFDSVPGLGLRKTEFYNPTLMFAAALSKVRVILRHLPMHFTPNTTPGSL